jgi:hypothetical protein
MLKSKLFASISNLKFFFLGWQPSLYWPVAGGEVGVGGGFDLERLTSFLYFKATDIDQKISKMLHNFNVIKQNIAPAIVKKIDRRSNTLNLPLRKYH